MLDGTRATAPSRRGPDRGASVLEDPTRPRAGPGPVWPFGLAAAIALIDLAMALDAFVLRPLISSGDPRGVIRVAVVFGAFALAARTRLRSHHPVAPPVPDDERPPAPAPDVSAPRPNDPPRTPTPARHPSPRRAAVQVQVLGPVAVLGAAAPLTAKSIELVAYLACHPQGIHEERIKAALWPVRAPRPQTWLNRVSITRTGLGRSANGAPLLPRFDRQVGRLDPSVQTDLDTLVEARTRAEHQPTTDAAATLAEALAVVRGRPFDMATGYEWAFTELHVAHAERVVVDVAHDLAEMALTLGDWRQTLWATDVGLRACPASELLYQERMRAYAAGGDRRGIESAMRDLRRTLAIADSSDVPSRDLVELSEHLHARLRRGAPTDPPVTARSLPPQ